MPPASSRSLVIFSVNERFSLIVSFSLSSLLYCHFSFTSRAVHLVCCTYMYLYICNLHVRQVVVAHYHQQLLPRKSPSCCVLLTLVHVCLCLSVLGLLERKTKPPKTPHDDCFLLLFVLSLLTFTISFTLVFFFVPHIHTCRSW